MSEIPLDLLFREILTLLPAHDLVRYRCVCKLWRHTIDDSSFIRTHLDRQIKNYSSNAQLIIIGARCERFYSLTLQPDDDDDMVDVEAKSLNNNHFVVSNVLANSCRGIMLVTGNDSNKYLWNPFTRHHHQLPPLGKPVGSQCQEVVGLAYDPMSDDYKVVRIDQCRDFNVVTSIIRSETYVYSLKLDCWRRIKDFPSETLLLRRGVFLNGALHWIKGCKDDLIVVLDLGTEDYRVLPLPCARKRTMNLGVMNGCLVWSCCSKAECLDVWLMKDYGVENSWIKLFSMANVSIRTMATLMPVTYFKGKGRERILLQLNHKELYWLDLQTHAMTKVRIRGSPDILSYQTCVESLVPLDSDVRRCDKTSETDDK